jgi:hypothetical protein
MRSRQTSGVRGALDPQQMTLGVIAPQVTAHSTSLVRSVPDRPTPTPMLGRRVLAAVQAGDDSEEARCIVNQFASVSATDCQHRSMARRQPPTSRRTMLPMSVRWSWRRRTSARWLLFRAGLLARAARLQT